jgi:hypothetical protein
MDFIHDQLASGRRFRCLTLVDDFTRQCLALHVDTSISGASVVAVLDQLAGSRGLPSTITTDKGPEFTGRALHLLAQTAGVSLNHIQPGKPPKMLSSNPSTAPSVTTASTSIGSVPSPKPASSSITGATNTTTSALTPPSVASRPTPSP